MRDVVRLIQTGKMIKHLYENRCKEISNKYHLTKNEIDILLFLANNQPYDTSRDIVEYRALSKSHVCKSVDSLFSRGYLKGEQDQRDRRLIHLKLQSEAMPAVREPQQMQQDFFNTIYRGIPVDELETVKAAFRKMARNIREDYQNGG